VLAHNKKIQAQMTIAEKVGQGIRLLPDLFLRAEVYNRLRREGLFSLLFF
jgi:hypothetical protein